jgi:hypothetical protein
MQELKPGDYCPLLKKDCIQMKCNWFIQVRGKDPNNGKDLDHWGCSIAWLPHLLIENANQSRQGAAATESFRNEMVKASENTIKAMVEISNITREDNKIVSLENDCKTLRLIDVTKKEN